MAEHATQIVMVDDDERLQAVVREFLENHGFSVVALSSGHGLEETLESTKPGLVLLDVMLPGDDGFTILRSLRASSRIPVIMLTACGDETDRIVGLEIGADDYLGKPFNPRELLARIKAVLRRVSEPSHSGFSGANGVVKNAGYALDEKRQKLAFADKETDLSQTECRILHAFMTRPGEVLSRDKVLELAFGDDHYVCDRNIDVYISRIRAILRKLGDPEQRIRTVWGSGYSWMEDA